MSEDSSLEQDTACQEKQVKQPIARSEQMTQLFEETRIKSLVLKNRFVRSATWSAVCDDRGYVTELTTEYYGKIADGGVGLIITGFQYVLPNGIAMPYQMGNYSDDLLPGLRRLTEAIHSRGGKVVAQLVHTGSKANPDLFFQVGDVMAPSSIQDPWTGRMPREMTSDDIVQVVEAYANAAYRSKKAGFDGVQLHGAHAYGINQFLSLASNKRSDEYGGDIAGRYHFLGNVLKAVRAAVGPDYPVMIKLSGNDYVEGGLTTEESLCVAGRLADDGIDCIEVSAGSRASVDGMIPSRLKIRRPEDEAYNAQLASRFKQSVSVPIITVGGIRSLDVASRVLDQELADYLALCRPLIREPHLINRWKSGDTAKATCVSCNGCFETGLDGTGVVCKVDRDKRQKKAPE